MAKNQHTTEQIISKLREAKVELGRGLKVPQVCKKLGVTEQAYYRRRKEFGGLGMDQARIGEGEHATEAFVGRCRIGQSNPA